MAHLPCDCHHAPPRGRLCGLYAAFLVDSVRYAKYRRYCVEGMHDVLARHSVDWLDQLVSTNGTSDAVCTSCGEVQKTEGSLSRLYVTAYPDGKQRRDYYATYCEACTKERMSEFDLHA